MAAVFCEDEDADEAGYALITLSTLKTVLFK